MNIFNRAALIAAQKERIKELEQALAVATIHTQQVEQVINERPFLVSLERTGRTNRWIFMRGNTPYSIETMGMLEDMPDQWRRDLLE